MRLKKLKKIVNNKARYSGVVLVISMLIMTIISVWSVSLFAFSNANAQVAYNQKKANDAFSAAQSGLDVALYIAAQASIGLPKTSSNIVSDAEADTVWNIFCAKINALAIGGHSVSATPTAFTDAGGSGTQIVIPPVNFASTDVDFTVRFFRYNTDSNSLCTIGIQSTGTDHSTSASGDISRTVSMNFSIGKDGEVLKYALASRGRMWITGDSTIHGNIYSSWKYQNLSPFNMTSDSTVEGTLNTILTNINPITGLKGPDLYAGTTKMPYDIETLAANGNPEYDVIGTPVFDSAGNPVYTVAANSTSPVYDDDYNIIYFEMTGLSDLAGQPVYDSSGQPVYNTQGTKVISYTDEIQGQSEGINYNVEAVEMPGMKLADYDTTAYYQATRTSSGGGGDIYCSSSATNYINSLSSLGDTNGTKYRYEYFPHNAGSYTTGSGLQVKRYIYKNQTFTNTRLPDSKNALFINCTFNGILYVDCGKTGSTYNNVRFDDCTFKGPIVTDTPSYSSGDSSTWWKKNCLYFTGEEDFNNVTDIPATILAPNFNVNLGNTNPDTGESNVLTGAIVGGIVDIRGNATIKGTVISMYDTSGYSSGYVNNIGATLGDGGSETTEPGDIGTITITPKPGGGLPSGINTPIIIKPVFSGYSESI